jgi:hypothetical protein
MPSSARLGTAEPVFQWAFRLILPGALGGEDLIMAVSTVSLPGLTFETTEVCYFATKYKFASKFGVNDMSCTVKDYVDFQTAANVWMWYYSVGDMSSGTINAPGEYKKPATLQTTNGRGEPQKSWSLIGCFPTTVEFGDLDYSGTDIVQINMTISIDKVENG